jgi:hypothetical protein
MTTRWGVSKGAGRGRGPLAFNAATLRCDRGKAPRPIKRGLVLDFLSQVWSQKLEGRGGSHDLITIVNDVMAIRFRTCGMARRVPPIRQKRKRLVRAIS